MKLIILALLMSETATPAKAPRFDALQFKQFMDHAAKFERQYLGCAPDARSSSECHAGAGWFDAKLWLQLQKEGAALFGTPRP